ncbi:hypothetical protein EROM_091280 [Encephalitozoon romaleae SJ-2008]|uniref:Uncharacterized protein n=1 Tax=Encephalitozoon romaleae (strain SJ-2008) TaxID=1178016 RepID=I7APH8_ENCRO|nr:hypothetical protein EROM_091280 [Encephalitozoon romaleae SJ-2008]AFN83744.1 hypothetical protein EROM_091280 [Encephalitozoon romaleae SJ-2008]
MKDLRAFFTEFVEAEKVVEVDFNQKMIELIRKTIVPVEMEDFISSASELELSDGDLEYYRGYFGYSQTYSLYKSMIRRIFSCGFSYKEIGLVIALLDNEAMCFKRLLPIFTRLTTYVKHNILDKNIVACCIALRSVLTYIPSTMNGKDEYILSLISYLTGIVSRHTSFVFINEKDADEIISTIDLLTRFCFAVDVSRISSGILKEIIFHLETLSNGKMALYEEIFAIICILETIPSVCRLVVGFTEIDFSSAYSLVQRLVLSRADHGGSDEWNGIHDRFLVAKYRSLEALHPWKAEFDRIMFYNDVESAKHPSKVLRSLKSLKKDVSWSDMIVFACHPGQQEEWLQFMFDDFFVRSPDHLVYIELFVGSIGDRADLLLYSGYLLLRSFEHIEAEKKWSVLVDLFLRNIQSQDQRAVRLRCIISDYICCSKSLEQRSIFLKAFIERLQKDFVCFNSSVIELLDMLLKGHQELPLETSNMIWLYLEGCIVKERRKERMEKELETMYVCVASRAMILSGSTIDFRESSTHPERYYELITSCLSWIKGKFPEEYIQRIKETMLYFLFDASREEVCELGLLMKGERSRFADKFEELYEASGV